MLWYLTRLTLSQGTFSSSLSGGGVIILSYCLSSPITPFTNPGQGFIYTYTIFFFYLDSFLLFFFYFFALQNKICLIGSCSIFLLIILFVIVFLIVRQFSPDDSWSSSNWESSFQLLLYHSWWSVYFCYLVHFKCECFYLFFTLWIIMGRVFFTSAEE